MNNLPFLSRIERVWRLSNSEHNYLLLFHGNLRSFGKHYRYSLDRFITAQDREFARALTEISYGRKQTHWMW